MEEGGGCGGLTLEELIEKHDWMATMLKDRADDWLPYSELEERAAQRVSEEVDDDELREMAEDRIAEDLAQQRQYINDSQQEIEDLLASGGDEEEIEELKQLIESWENEYLDMISDEVDDVRRELQSEAEDEIEEENLQEVHQEFEHFLDDAEFELRAIDGRDVWRVVVVEEHVDPTRLTGIGRFWTREKNLARFFMSEYDLAAIEYPKVLRFRARADSEYIDACDTLEANMGGKLWGNETDETEVRFYKHAPLYVHEVEIIDMDLDDPERSMWKGVNVIETLPIEGTRRC